MVEHNQGCIHMTCKCKAQFCYICGLKWRTCTCADAQLGTIRAAADARRRQTEAQERASRDEAEELREILQRIEEYEINEATRLAREEEEMRLAIQEARERKQEARVIAVSKQYFELGQELELLQTLQRVAITEKYEEELKTLRREVRLRDDMMARHATELQVVDAEGKAKVVSSESDFDRDFQARVAKERQLQDEYAQRLVAYWTGRPGGDVKITEAKEALRNTHTAEYRQWEAIRRTSHQQVVSAAKGDTDRVRRRHEAELTTLGHRRYKLEADLDRERRAAYKWLEAVSAVRVEMIRSMEEEAYNREDGD